MRRPTGTRKDRAALAGLVADRDHPVPRLADELSDALAAVAADVDAQVRHHGDRLGADGCDLCAGAGDLETVPGPRAEHALCHLRPSRIVGAHEQDSLLRHDHDFTLLTSTATKPRYRAKRQTTR